MTAAAKTLHVAGASAQARATKVDRLKFLEAWALDNPLQTIEAAREAVRARFGISLGTKTLSDTLRNAKALWEAKRRESQELPPLAVPAGTDPIQVQVHAWAQGMRKAGVRLIELMPDGHLRLEFETPTPTPQASSRP
jgi:hypothetical protein